MPEKAMHAVFMSTVKKKKGVGPMGGPSLVVGDVVDEVRKVLEGDQVEQASGSSI